MSAPEPLRKGNRTCCVVGCGNRTSTTSKDVHFYRFPPNNEVGRGRRARWIDATRKAHSNGKKWFPKTHSTICSEHFIGGKKTEHPHHPAYIPTIFPENPEINEFSKDKNIKAVPKLKRKKTEEISPKNTNMKEIIDSHWSTVAPNEASCQTETNKDVFCREIKEKTFSCCLFFLADNSTVESAVQTTFIYDEKITYNKTSDAEASQKNCRCCTSCSLDKNWLESSSLNSEEHFRFLTGVTKSVFIKLFKMLDLPRDPKFSKIRKLLIFLIKLKSGGAFSTLGAMFSINHASAFKIFVDVLQNIARATRDHIFWPSKDVVKSTMPVCLSACYPQCRVIVDWIEMRNASSGMPDRSDLRENFVPKVLIGVTPCGTISFCSTFGDTQIMSDILDKLEEHDLVLTDNGFPDVDSKENIFLKVASLAPKGTVTEREVGTWFTVVNVRLGAERAIRRMKSFRILNEKIPFFLLPHLPDITHVCCVLVNMMGSLLRN